jgi:hypothetical protein
MLGGGELVIRVVEVVELEAVEVVVVGGLVGKDEASWEKIHLKSGVE